MVQHWKSVSVIAAENFSGCMPDRVLRLATSVSVCVGGLVGEWVGEGGWWVGVCGCGCVCACVTSWNITGIFLETVSVIKKKSETELTGSVLKKRSKIHKRSKGRFLIWTKQEKTYTFSKKSSFSGHIQQKNRKSNNNTDKINSTYLVSVGCGRLAEEKPFFFKENF